MNTIKNIIWHFLFISTLLLLFPLSSFSIDEETAGKPTIALINRVIEIVERSASEIEWEIAKIGDLLNSGDIIKTGASSFSLVRFYDNSLLRVRELSEIIVYADRDLEAYHRNIEVKRGAIGFDINKKEIDRFQFSTPSSVASIRGSTGSVIVLPNEFDILLMITGMATLRNLLTDQELEVIGGEIAFSSSDGTLEKRPFTPEDLKLYGDSESTRDRRRRKLEIRTRDDLGNLNTIIIEYEEDENDK
jgi:hypothetical protein